MRKEFVRLGVERLEQRDNPSSGWSFWDDTYLGAVISGVGQGVLNTVNGVQDAVVGIANLPAMFYNNTIGNLGGNGVIILATLGVGSASTAGVVGETAAGAEAVVVVSEQGVGAIQAATIVREIGRGERIADLIQELAGLTYNAGGAEHAIITFQNGQRLIVQGSQTGISFETFGDTLRRIILHTHPTTTGPSAADFAMLEQLGQKSSWIYELFGGGLTKFGR